MDFDKIKTGAHGIAGTADKVIDNAGKLLGIERTW